MWIVITLVYFLTPLARGVNLGPFSDLKICLDHDLHPMFRLKWNEEHFHLYKVANHPNEEEVYHLRSDWLSKKRIDIIASFANNQSARLKLHRKESVMWMPSYLKLLDFESLDLFYRDLYSKFGHEIHLNRVEIDSQHNKTWGFEFSLIQNNFPALKGRLSITCDKVFTYSNCRLVLASTHPHNRVIWQFGLGFNHTADGGEILFRPLGDPHSINAVLSALWTRNEQGYNAQLELKHDSQQVFEMKGHYAVQQSKLKAVAYSKPLNLKSRFHWEKLLKEEGSQINLSATCNFIHRPSSVPFEYDFELRQGSAGRLLDLRHNVSSMLYYFEGNMTIDKEDALKKPSIITRIWQKIRSPVSDSFTLDLEQVINQTGTWFWETTLMRSGFVDMHVSANWDGSISNFYAKKFQFKSYLENLLTSFNLIFSYSNSMHFHHRFELPFKGLAYEVLLERSSVDSLLPLKIHFLYQNELKSNTSSTIASLHLLDRREYMEVCFSSEPQLQQALAGLLNFTKKVSLLVSDEDNTVNKILKPVLGQPTIAHWSGKLAKTVTNAIKDNVYMMLELV